MATIALGIDIDTADVTAADRAFDKLEGRLRDTEKRFSGVSGASQKADHGIRGVADATRQAETRTAAAVAQYQKMTAVWASLAAVAGGTLIAGLARSSDAYTEITNKLRVVAGEQGNVNALFGELLRVANETRVPVESIATLYQRTAMAAGELGASQSQILQFTENVGRALALQGGSAEAASGALLQLSQALGGGIVRAEEFNSILEGAFPIAQAAARGIDEAGGSVAKLRNLVIEGKISSDEFFSALLSQTAALEAAFANTAPTIGQAFTVLQNNTMAAVGSMNDMLGVTSALASGIIVLGENIDRLIVYAGTAAAIFGTRLAVGMAASAVATLNLSTALVALRGAVIRTGIGVLVVGAGELVFRFMELVKATGGWGEALSLLGEVALGVWDGIKTSATAIPPALAAVWNTVRADFIAMAQSLTISWSNFLGALGLEGLAASVAETASSLGDAFLEAQGAASAAADVAKGQLTEGFNQAATAVGKLRQHVAAAETNLGGATGAAADLADGLGGSGGRSGSGSVAGSAKKAADETAKITEHLEHQQQAAAALATAMRGIAFGTVTGAEGIGGAVSALTDGAFGETLNKAFEDAATHLSNAFSDALSGLGKTGMSDFAVASIGTGIGIAATGVLNGNAQQIGGGIGSAIGGALGSSLTSGMGGLLGAVGGPLGMALGGALGSLVPELFGGGRDYTRPEGVAFQGTAIERRVRALESFPIDDGNTGAAHIAYAGVVSVVKDFENVLSDLVKGVTASAKGMETDLRSGIDVMKAVDLITLEMDRRPTSSIEKGAEERAKRFQERMLEIVDIAQRVATAGATPLTQAQAAWRAFQEQFSAENVEILKAIGFSVRQIKDAQKEIGRDLAAGFNKEMLDTITDAGTASKAELGRWLRAEMAALTEWRDASLATAREIGADTGLVRSAFRAQSRDLRGEWREMMDDIAGSVEETAGRIVRVFSNLEKLQFRGGFLDEIVGDGMRGNRPAMREWLRVQQAILEEQRQAAVKEARQMGVEVALINRAFGLRQIALEKDFREKMGAVANAAREREARAAERAAERVAAAAQGRIDVLQGRLNSVEQQRADVLGELTRRAEEARRAEQTLADARASLAAGDLAPGGPLDRLAELQRQFGEAIRSQDASRAASLAQPLLQQGQQVFASGGGYNDLFRMVNQQLAALQGQFSGQAGRLEGRLDAATFTSVTEKSTAALLRALARLDERLENLGDRIDAQTRRMEAAQQRQRVGRAA